MLRGIFPILAVESSFDKKLQWLFRSRQRHFQGGVFGHQAAQQVDFFVVGEFVAGANDTGLSECASQQYRYSDAAGGADSSTIYAVPFAAGTFEMAMRSTTITMEVMTLASGP